MLAILSSDRFRRREFSSCVQGSKHTHSPGTASINENALPVIVTHGWPGSILEQLKLIEPLTNPTAHGGTAADAFQRGDSVEKLAYERLSFVYAKGIGYGFQMGLRPQTLYGIADSPVGLAAYFLDHDARSLELIARVFNGESEGLTRDDVLDNVTIAWLTNTGVSGGRLYWENKGASFFGVKGVRVPVAVSVFPDELYPAPRSWAEQAYPNLIHYNKAAQGRTLRCLGAAEVPLRGNARGLQIAAQVAEAQRARGGTALHTSSRPWRRSK